MKDNLENNTKPIKTARYRTMTLSIIVFLLLIVAILAVNYYAVTQINRDTANIDTTSKMRDSIQAINKNLFDLKLSYGEDPFSPHIQGALSSLKDNSDFITQRIKLFQTEGSLNKKVDFLPNIDIGPKSSVHEQAFFQRIVPEWKSYKPAIDNYLETATEYTSTSTPLELAVNQAQGSGVVIYDQINRLAVAIKQQADNRSKFLKLIQLLGLAAAIVYLFTFLFFILRKLRKSAEEAYAAQRETNSIMKTVNEGLFLVDKDYNIGSQYSSRLEEIVNQEEIAHKKLGELLDPMIPQSEAETVKEYIEQLYNPKVKERLIKDLNPLNELEVRSINKQGEFEYRYLNFNFTRVYEGSEIASILASVSDVSRAVKLEKQLEKERTQNDHQLAMLTDILSADERVMASFIRHSNEATNNINNILKKPGRRISDLRKKADDIFNYVHTLKDEAITLKMDNFVKMAETFEDKVSVLQNKRNLTGNDFLALTVELEALIEDTNKADKLLRRLIGERTKSEKQAGDIAETMAQTLDPAASEQATQAQAQPLDFSNKALAEYFNELTLSLAKKANKNIAFRAVGFEHLEDVADIEKLKELITQLIHHAVFNGIETPETRSSQNKNAMGVVRVQVVEHDANTLRISVDDDGQGLDIGKLRTLAVEQGILSQEQVNNLSDSQAQRLILHPRLSLQPQASTNGNVETVSMEGVRERVRELSGQVGILSEKGKYSRFVIQLPINASSESTPQVTK